MNQRVYEFLYDPKMYKDVPCQTNCPVHTDVEGYIKLIGQGKFEAAHRLIRETNPFPAICGRVCQHYCERGCNRGKMDKSVAIMQLKRVATDYSKGDFELPEQRYNTLDAVAVVGAGPAGLTAAQDLAKMGYRVTVFEAMSHPGGMMRYGIPKFRLPREVIDFEVEYVKRLGVEIKYNVRIGKDVQLHELREQFKVVLLAAGAHKPVTLNIPGENLNGVYHGITFMLHVNMEQNVPPMEGKTVAIIGGGFTAMDVSRSCVRLGAKKVYIVYRRTRDEIPVNEKEILEAEEEEIDFRYLEAPMEVISSDGKNVSGLKVIKNKLGEPDASGRRRPVPIEGSEFVLDVDYVMPAVSQNPDMSFVPEDNGFKLNKWGTLDVDKNSFSTNIPGVFSCGDFVTGTRDIILVVADGHNSAIAIDAHLRGAKPDFSSKIALRKKENLRPEKRYMYDAIPRQHPETIPTKKRLSTFEEMEHTFTAAEAADEAARCLQCSHAWAYDSESCILCHNCIDVCPQECLSLKPLSELQFNRLYNENISLEQQGIAGVKIFRDLCIRCTFCEQVCPTDSISFTCFTKAATE
ncbi:MAG: hypothetical protein IEMM0002_1131 [bacterium]|nr:MAG: hypothetical protein IEMM0002_1131 [bacterium]